MAKTGSTAIEAQLRDVCDIVFTGHPRMKHMQVRRFERFVRPLLETMGENAVETTCVIRHPEDWLGSWYRYRQRAEIAGKPNSTADVSFEAFVSAYLSEAPPPYAQVGRPSRFVARADGSLGIDHLFRYAHFASFVAFLEDRFGRRFDIPVLNASPAGGLALSRKTRGRLETELAEDYAIYEEQAA